MCATSINSYNWDWSESEGKRPTPTPLPHMRLWFLISSFFCFLHSTHCNFRRSWIVSYKELLLYFISNFPVCFYLLITWSFPGGHHQCTGQSWQRSPCPDWQWERENSPWVLWRGHDFAEKPSQRPQETADSAQRKGVFVGQANRATIWLAGQAEETIEFE